MSLHDIILEFGIYPSSAPDGPLHLYQILTDSLAELASDLSLLPHQMLSSPRQPMVESWSMVLSDSC